MGKTQLMINELVVCLLQGQPKSVVVCASTEHARYLEHRLCETLDEIEEPYTILKGRSAIVVDEAIIEFTSIHSIDFWRCGRRGYGEFWHHYAEWCYNRYIDQTDKECTGN